MQRPIGSNLDVDEVARLIDAQRAAWERVGLTVEPCTWLDQDAPWPQPLTTDRAAIGNPRSVGVIIRNGETAEALLVVYAAGWADADYVRFTTDDAVISEYVELAAAAAVLPLLDRIIRHLTGR